MNVVRWKIVDDIRSKYPDVEVMNTYGAYTKAMRRELGQLKKTHANDAYAMGEFHPLHRHREEHFEKKRRNNRVLAKFYDAKVIDIRDGKAKKGSELGCNRTKRRESRNNENTLRKYRGKKVTKGHTSIRCGRHSIQAGDVVLYKNRDYEVKTARFRKNRKRGQFETVEFKPKSSEVPAEQVRVLRQFGGWVHV